MSLALRTFIDLIEVGCWARASWRDMVDALPTPTKKRARSFVETEKEGNGRQYRSHRALARTSRLPHVMCIIMNHDNDFVTDIY